MKKGYFFTVDAIFAVTILTIGAVLIFTQTNIVQSSPQPINVAQEMMNYYSDTKMTDLNSDYIDAMRRNGTIKNPDLTLMQQAAEFYHVGAIGQSKIFIASVTNFSSVFNVEIIMNSQSLYLDGDGFLEAENVYSIKDIVYSVNETQPIGPYITEVRVWI